MNQSVISQTAHLTTDYILQDAKGRLHIYRHRPTDAYAGRRDSDQYALMQGLFISEPSHDLQLGECECVFNTAVSWGIASNPMTAKIVAKCSHVWDYAQPIGKRMSEENQSVDWKEYFSKYRSQAR